MRKIAVLPGDGVGPEVTEQALLVLEAAKKKYHFEYSLEKGLIGGEAIDATGEPFPAETKRLVLASDMVLLGAVGGPRWDGLPGELRPEKGLLEIRKTLGLYANLRPVRCWPQLLEQSPLKNEVINGVDLLVVRELSGGAYYGAKGTRTEGGEEQAFDTIEYSEKQIRRIIKMAFELARKRRRRVTSVDKSNVMETSRLWRKIAQEEAHNYPEVSLNHLYVDNCAMQLCLKPAQFDVVVTENMFGDILSDQASVLGASLGMLPSASLGDGPSLFEPAHGSAPDIAGQDKANPLAAILSVAMMLRFSFNNGEAAGAVEKAVETVLSSGLRTVDIYSAGTRIAGTRDMGRAVAKCLAS
ncbi:MAG: 3-isopropylmalate dehydrogenase [Peptococcaceae bacterium]|jgi:3-isopropylmalate dehydrogenase|nr:3-isopropylmalate dehydrogenase [Peptococcaceae bacterium]MDH7524715.1 3-isopropylmalate dehydrogenase [Peptococcaceae bacterium]